LVLDPELDVMTLAPVLFAADDKVTRRRRKTPPR
jgi:hypothetical protein